MPRVPPSLRSLALADLTPADVRWMIREGETLVELKARPPNEGIGPTIASFANTLGGWVILGVDDETRDVVGWKPPGRADDLDYLRDRLRHEVDPMPPFAAKPMRVGRRRVSVIRVYESTDTPHIVRGTGSVFIREPGGKRPVQEHARLVELARRGEDAEQRAHERLRSLPVVVNVLRTPDSAHPSDELRDIRWVARAAPLTISPVTRDWPLRREAADWCLRFVDQMVRARGPFGREGPNLEPYGRAVVADVRQMTGSESSDRGVLVADSGGVFGVELTEGTLRGDRPTVLLEAMLDQSIKPLTRALAAMLAEAEAYGRSIVDIWCLLPPKGDVYDRRRDTVPRDLHAAGELTVPAEQGELDALAQAWHRELQRAVGVPKFEGESEAVG